MEIKKLFDFSKTKKVTTEVVQTKEEPPAPPPSNLLTDWKQFIEDYEEWRKFYRRKHIRIEPEKFYEEFSEKYTLNKN
jgi:hypothetical protein